MKFKKCYMDCEQLYTTVMPNNILMIIPVLHIIACVYVNILSVMSLAITTFYFPGIFYAFITFENSIKKTYIYLDLNEIFGF